MFVPEPLKCAGIPPADFNPPPDGALLYPPFADLLPRLQGACAHILPALVFKNPLLRLFIRAPDALADHIAVMLKTDPCDVVGAHHPLVGNPDACRTGQVEDGGVHHGLESGPVACVPPEELIGDGDAHLVHGKPHLDDRFRSVLLGHASGPQLVFPVYLEVVVRHIVIDEQMGSVVLAADGIIQMSYDGLPPSEKVVKASVDIPQPVFVPWGSKKQRMHLRMEGELGAREQTPCIAELLHYRVMVEPAS